MAAAHTTYPPPHTPQSPKTHSHGPPLRASLHPRRGATHHLPQKQFRARARRRPGGTSPAVHPKISSFPQVGRGCKTVPRAPLRFPPSLARAQRRAGSRSLEARCPDSLAVARAPGRGTLRDGVASQSAQAQPDREHFATKSKQKKANATLPRETKVCLYHAGGLCGARRWLRAPIPTWLSAATLRGLPCAGLSPAGTGQAKQERRPRGGRGPCSHYARPTGSSPRLPRAFLQLLRLLLAFLCVRRRRLLPFLLEVSLMGV